jgi:hypothetical protein
MGFDLYPLQTIESKKAYYAKAIAEKWLTVFTHDPETPWAYVEKDEVGRMVARGVSRAGIESDRYSIRARTRSSP